jgi:hypothetical protein
MLFRLRHQDEKPEFDPYPQQSAAALQLVEKDLENWIAAHPELLFGAERVLVIGQSVSGQSMADILALDGDGRLVIIEMKRAGSDRATVGQLLEYAARMADEGTYEQLDKISRNYLKQTETSLSTRFRQFFDDETGEDPKLGSTQRLVVVAPAADEELRRIVRWLKGSGVAIDFVPFTLYSAGDGGDIFIDIEPLPKIEPSARTNFISAPAPWAGDWSFNTNETYAPGAYVKMFEQGVIAIYGYETGPENLTGSKPGERVLAFVNRKGVMAAGVVKDGEVFAASSIFGEKNEFHLRVKWNVIVDDRGVVAVHEVKSKFSYTLPYRSVFCRISRHDVADWIEDQLCQRRTVGGPSA